jgi:hypothetical protein
MRQRFAADFGDVVGLVVLHHLRQRWITTLRLPTIRPTSPATTIRNAGGSAASDEHGIQLACLTSPALHHLAQLEDRQIHGHHHAADQHAKDHDDQRLDQAGMAATASSTSRS